MSTSEGIRSGTGELEPLESDVDTTWASTKLDPLWFCRRSPVFHLHSSARTRHTNGADRLVGCPGRADDASNLGSRHRRAQPPVLEP